jgi:hypothetical protein
MALSVIDHPENINGKYGYRTIDKRLKSKFDNSIASEIKLWMKESEVNPKEFSMLMDIPYGSINRATTRSEGINSYSLLMLRKNGIDLNALADQVLVEVGL